MIGGHLYSNFCAVLQLKRTSATTLTYFHYRCLYRHELVLLRDVQVCLAEGHTPGSVVLRPGRSHNPLYGGGDIHKEGLYGGECANDYDTW